MNGDLIRAAEKAGFDVLLTTDTSLPHQQNLEGNKLAIVILSRNKWSVVQTRLAQIVDAVNAAKPGSLKVSLYFPAAIESLTHKLTRSP